MRIVVCGCSFSATVGDNSHWSEHLARYLDAELVNLARQGISNNVIRLQIEEAIKLNPDWVFINATTTDRIEFTTDKNNVVNPELGYSFNLGLKNFNYNKDDNSRMISETLFSIVDWQEHFYRGKTVDSNTKEAVRNYAAFIYDLHWRIKVDNWVLNSGLWDLHERGIKFIYNQTIINENDDHHGMPKWFVEKYFVPKELSLMDLFRKHVNDVNPDPGYHTPPEVQKWLADQYLELMKKQS